MQAEEHASEALTILLMYQGTEQVPDGKRQVGWTTSLLPHWVENYYLVLLFNSLPNLDNNFFKVQMSYVDYVDSEISSASPN